LILLDPGVGADTVTLAIEAIPLDDAIRQRFVADYLGDSEGTRREQRERVIQELVWPDFLPRVTRVLVDSEERIWLEHFAFGDSDRTWTFYSRVDGWMGAGSVPGQSNLLDARGDLVLLRTTDELGVPRLEVWPIIR
jgi:hypothetical protein